MPRTAVITRSGDDLGLCLAGSFSAWGISAILNGFGDTVEPKVARLRRDVLCPHLATDTADQMTGKTLPVDSGWSAH